MQFTWIWMILFGVCVILFPQIIAYFIGGLFVFLWLTSFIFAQKLKKSSFYGNENYVKFGNYKIFR